MAHSKIKQFVQFVQFSRPTLKFVFGTLLLSLLSDDIFYEDHKQSSMLVRFIPYMSLSIMMLIVWCAVYYFLTDPHGNSQVKGCVDFPVIGRLDPQDVTGRLDPQLTRLPDLPLIDPEVRDMFHCYMNENRFDEFPHHVDSEILSPEAIARSSRAQQRSDFVSITIHSERPLPAVLRSRVTLPVGYKVLHRTFETGLRTHSSEWDNLMIEVTKALRQAQTIDVECTLQFGSFAVLKYTEAGPKWRRLQKDWTPVISNIQHSPCNFVDLVLTGFYTKWIIRGFNLQQATLKASTMDVIETINISHHKKAESGEDVLFCDEPHLLSTSAPLFQQEVYICASNFVEVEDGVTYNLQTEPKSVKRAYWISVLESLMPSPWTIFVIASLSFLGGLSHGTDWKQDDSFQTSASNYLDLEHDGNILDVDKEANSILSHILSELYKCCLVYIFAIFFPFFITILWQLSDVLISPLVCTGNDIHALARGLAVAQTSQDVTNSSPTTPASSNSCEGYTTSRCPAAVTPVAEDFFEETTSSPNPAICVGGSLMQSLRFQEEVLVTRTEEAYKSSPVFGAALTPASAYYKNIVNLRTASTAMVQNESFQQGDTLLEEHSQSPDYDDLSTPPSIPTPANPSNAPDLRVGNEMRTKLPGVLPHMCESVVIQDLESSSDNNQRDEKVCSGQVLDASYDNDHGAEKRCSTTSYTLSVKHQDWNTFERYLRDHGLELPRCNGANILDFLRYLDQFGQSKIHLHSCRFYGDRNPPNNPCQCPLRHDWRSLHVLVKRLRAEFQKNGGNRKSNPFAGRLVHLYLREVQESQEKASGIARQSKKRKCRDSFTRFSTPLHSKDSIGSQYAEDHQHREQSQLGEIRAQGRTPNNMSSGTHERFKKQKMLVCQAAAPSACEVKFRAVVATIQTVRDHE